MSDYFLAQRFALFRICLHADLPQQEVDEFQAAFYAGAESVYDELLRVAGERKDLQSAVDFLNSVDDELREFDKFIKDKAREQRAEQDA